jgi:hypothetical protein
MVGGRGLMKKVFIRRIFVLVAGLLWLLLPAMVHAQGDVAAYASPPIEQPLVREGTFAVKLSTALGLGTTVNEAEAENRLASVGIAPLNGWIADYPVTPDIIGELQKAVGDAANTGKISMDRYEALERLADVSAELDLQIQPNNADVTAQTLPGESETYSGPGDLEDYYYETGPPIVTYYAPPPYYYSYYLWVPYPFWCYGVQFPGYYILRDFHRPIHYGNRTVIVSNQFRDSRSHKVLRINPATRYYMSFRGMGSPHHRNIFPTAVPQNRNSHLNVQRAPAGTVHGSYGRYSATSRSFTPPSRVEPNFSPPPNRAGSYRMPSRIGRTNRPYIPPPGVDRSRNPSPAWTYSQGSHSNVNRSYTRPPGTNRSFNSTTGGNRNYIMPHRSIEPSRAPAGVGRANRSNFGVGGSFHPPSGGSRSFSRPTGGGGSFTRGFGR